MNEPYHFEIPLKNGGLCKGEGFSTIEECASECKKICKACGVNYDDRDVKLFMVDSDGKWEVTEEGELAG